MASAACAGALVLGGAAAAEAATSHSVSGTVYESGGWYKSSTTRTVSSTTNIVLSLTSIPTRGIEWRLWNSKNNTVFSPITTYTSTGTHTLDTNVLGGTIFQNDNRKHDRTCTVRCGENYNYAGNEVY